jgi:hypothetical protein
MKAILAGAAILLSTLAFAPKALSQEALNWDLIGQDGNGSDIYVDRGSINSMPGGRSFLFNVYQVLPGVDRNGVAIYGLILEGSCSRTGSNIVALASIASYNESGRVLANINYNNPMQAANPNSVIGSAIDWVCSTP